MTKLTKILTSQFLVKLFILNAKKRTLRITSLLALFLIASNAFAGLTSFTISTPNATGTYTVNWSGSYAYTVLYERAGTSGSFSSVWGGSGSPVSKSFTKLPGTYQYYIQVCVQSGGPYPPTCSNSTTKSVTIAAAPTVNASFSPTTINESGSATLTWSSTNATSCSASGISGVSATSGTATYYAPTNMSANIYNPVTVTCTGTGGSAQKTPSLTVNWINDAPTITSIGLQTVEENNSTGGISFTIGDEETSVNSLSVTGTSSNTALVPNNSSNITFQGSGSNRTVNITPAANQFGSSTITLSVSDGSETTSASFTLNVIEDNSNIYSYCESTSGYQVINVGSNKSGSDIAAVNNEYDYDMDVAVDGVIQSIYFVLSEGETVTYNDIVARLNSELQGATASLQGGNVRITSDSVGSNSSVVLSNVGSNANHISEALAGYQGIESPVNGAGSGTDCYVNTPVAPVLASTPTPDPDIDAIKELQGNYSVSPSGSFSYTIPILAAPGSGGFAPKLALSYNSESTGGNAGYGWSLNSDLSISRCRQTYSSDKKTKPITFTSEDRLCLNGAKLHLVSGSWMGNGSVYKTEVDSYSRITINGVSNGQPSSFIVEQRGGITEYYGTSSNSKVTLSGGSILEWKLSDKYDPAGNRINYEYIISEYEYLLHKINYAYGSTSTPSAYVLLNYEYQNTIKKYVSGEYYYSGSVISEIDSRNEGQQIRRYELDQNESDGDIFTNAAKECVGSSCTPWTYFYSTNPRYINFQAPGNMALATDAKFRAYGDFNGDGITDVVWRPMMSGSALKFAFGSVNGSQFSFTEQSFIGTAPYVNFWLDSPPGDLLETIDFNMDGHDDLITYDDVADIRRVYLSKPVSSGIWKLSGTPEIEINAPSQDNYLYHDINGDGLRDFVGVAARTVQYLQPGGTLSPLTGFSVLNLPSSNCGSTNIVGSRSESGDFNGDGRVDFIFPIQVCNNGVTTYETAIFINQEVANGDVQLIYYDSIVTGATEFRKSDNSGYLNKLKISDLNSDGLSDVVIGIPGSGFNSYKLSTGSSLTNAIPINVNLPYDTAFFDMDGDGGLDAIYLYSPNNQDFYFRVHYWNSLYGYFEPTPQQNSSALGGLTVNDYNNKLELRDLDGNGTPDFITLGDVHFGSSTTFGFYAELNNATSEGGKNRIKSISTESGRGLELNISYENIANSNHYSYQNGYTSGSAANELYCQEIIDGDTCWDRKKAYTSLTELNADINTPFANFDSSIQQELKYPVVPVKSGKTVVSKLSVRTSKAYGTYSNDTVDYDYFKSTSYFYEGAKNQASGRGFLGFSTVQTIDHETGLRKEVNYRQDWPFVGKAYLEKTFDKDQNLISSTTSNWVLGDCYDESGNEISGCRAQKEQDFADSGSVELGPVHPHKLGSSGYTQTFGNWNIDSSFSNLMAIDSNGNITFSRTETYDDNLNTLLLEVEKTFEYDYSGSTYSMQLGRLTQEETVSTNSEGTITRVNGFDYYPSGTNQGRLYHIYQEPGSNQFGATTTISYDAFGNEAQKYITEDSSGSTRYLPYSIYDSKGRYPVTTKGKMPGFGDSYKTLDYVISRNSYGSPTEIRRYISSNNSVTERIAYTAFGTEYFRANSSGAATTIFASNSDSACPYYTEYAIQKQSADGSASIQCFDKGRVAREGVKAINGDWILVGKQYDAQGNVVRQTSPYKLGETIYLTEYQHDALGRVTYSHAASENSPDTTTTIDYGFKYKKVTNSLLHTQYEYTNALGQIVRTIDAGNNSTYFTFDAQGNLTEMEDSENNTTTLVHDILGNKLSMSDPDKGNWLYRYNAFGDMTCQQDANNQHTIQTYDKIGRVSTAQQYTAGGTCENPSGSLSSNAAYQYDIGAYGAPYLQKDLVSGYEKQISYDNFGRPEIVRTRINNLFGQLEDQFEKTTYNQYGQVFQYFDAARNSASFNSNGIQYFYNHGHLERLRDAVYENGTSRKEYFYVEEADNFNSPSLMYFGGALSHRITRDAGNGQIQNINSWHDNLPFTIQDLELIWDSVGNLEERWEHGAGVRTNFNYRNLFENFTYDSMNRLETYNVSGDASHNHSMVYGDTGNIESRTNDGVTYTYSYGNQCTAQAGPHAVCRYFGTGSNEYYYYDNNGNQTSGGGRTIQYNVSDRPTYISKNGHTTTFAYAPDNTRYKRVDTKGTETTAMLTIGSVEKILLPDGTLQWKRYIGDFAQVIQTVDEGGLITAEDTKYLLRDHLGSVNFVVDESGTVDEELDYDPWGMRRVGDTWQSKDMSNLIADHGIFTEPTTIHGYTNHEMLDDTRLIHMNGRIYDPMLARFVQADPIIQDPFQSQSLNRYSYLWNNPLNSTDPSGFCDNNCEVLEDRENIHDKAWDKFAEEIANKTGADGTISKKDFIDAAVKLSAALGKAVEFKGTNQNGESANVFVDGVSKSSSDDGGGRASDDSGGGSSDDIVDMFLNSMDDSDGVSESSAQKGYTDADKRSMGALIQNLGQSSGLLDSDFEIELFQRWWNGDGSNLEIDQATFQEILSVGVIDMRNLRPVPLSNGTSGYAAAINTYGSSKYNYAIGTGTVYLDSNKQPVGFIDFYNFDRGNRASFVAERITRSVGEFGKMYDAKDYYIYRGVLGP